MSPTLRACQCRLFCHRVMLGWLRAFRGEPGAWSDMLSLPNSIAVHEDR